MEIFDIKYNACEHLYHAETSQGKFRIDSDKKPNKKEAREEIRTGRAEKVQIRL